MEATDRIISIWFFIGLSLIVNGGLIFGAGISELIFPPRYPLVLASLHAPIWWGGFLFVAGVFYCRQYMPARFGGKSEKPVTAD